MQDVSLEENFMSCIFCLNVQIQHLILKYNG